ncbi:MAG: hypothetical protein EOO38_16390, partial [Cytophagaceae bacterium]
EMAAVHPSEGSPGPPESVKERLEQDKPILSLSTEPEISQAGTVESMLPEKPALRTVLPEEENAQKQKLAQTQSPHQHQHLPERDKDLDAIASAGLGKHVRGLPLLVALAVGGAFGVPLGFALNSASSNAAGSHRLASSSIAVRSFAADASMLEPLLNELVLPISRVGADGAYDQTKVYDYLHQRQIQAIIPPRSNAVLWTDLQG